MELEHVIGILVGILAVFGAFVATYASYNHTKDEVEHDELQEEWRKANERAMEARRNGFKKAVTHCKYCGRITKNEHEFCVGCGAPV